MSKRTIAKMLPIGLAASMLLGSVAYAEDLTVANGLSPKHVISTQGFDPWMACVSEKAGDAINFKYFPGGQIAKTKKLLDALNSGVADLTTILVGYVSSKMPLNGVSMLPGLGSTAAEVITAYSKAVRSGPIAEEFVSNEVFPIFVMALPAYQIISRVGPLRSADDFSGKVVRSAGGAMNLTIGALGSSAAEIPSSDMYVAMERGTIDATLSAYTSIKSYSIDTLMNAASTNGEFGGFTMAFSMRLDKWNATSPAVQKIMLACGADTEASFAKHLDDTTAGLQDEFRKAGIDIYEFTQEELTAISGKLSGVSSNWVDRLAKRGLPAADVLKSYTALIKGM